MRKWINLEKVKKLEEEDKAWYFVGPQQLFVFFLLAPLSCALFYQHHDQLPLLWFI